MKLNPQYLEKIASLTLDHYNQHADEFWRGTRDHDVKQNISALLQWIEGKLYDTGFWLRARSRPQGVF
jgi:hypothetical protein